MQQFNGLPSIENGVRQQRYRPRTELAFWLAEIRPVRRRNRAAGHRQHTCTRETPVVANREVFIRTLEAIRQADTVVMSKVGHFLVAV